MLVALLLAGCSSAHDDAVRPSSSTSTTTPTTTADPDDVYADPASWLCRPDTDDGCDDDLDATAVAGAGRETPVPFTAATDAPIDCFYVYPTVSNDPGERSDMEPGVEEQNVVRNQAARLGEVCDLYAPIYRQATIPELQRTLGGRGRFFAATDEAYPDVLAAWRHYLAVDNHGRGVIVIGHSQGSGHLVRLLKEEIDPNADQRDLLVSAILLGTNAHARDFPHLHVCASGDDTGCIVSYSSFRADKPPPADSYFGRPQDDEPAICTNPAAPAGGSAELHPFFQPMGWGVDVDTPFVTFPGFVTAECVVTDGFSYLALTVHGNDVAKDLRGDLTPQWGMHLIDANVAMGDLVELARTQAAAWSR
jgi:hypothetical protein